MLFKELETERLFLRKVKLEDTKILWDKFFSDYQQYKFYEYEEIKNYEEFEQKIANQIKRYPDGEYYRWNVVTKVSGELIGSINLHHYDIVNNNIKIGYFILPEYRNIGYATECVFKTIDFAFDILKVHRITAGTIEGNMGSNKTLLKTGFILEGTKKQDHKIDGTYYDSNIFGLLNTDNLK